jgi:hypothetical protein
LKSIESGQQSIIDDEDDIEVGEHRIMNVNGSRKALAPLQQEDEEREEILDQEDPLQGLKYINTTEDDKPIKLED